MKLSSSDTSAVNVNPLKFLSKSSKSNLIFKSGQVAAQILLAFLISTTADAKGRPKSVDPIGTSSQGLTHYFTVSSAPNLDKTISLLNFEEHQDKNLVVNENYNRMKHFGTWIRDGQNTGCLNTRGEILLRDADGPVQYNSSGCTIVSGTWHDPYSGNDYTTATDMQIDHLVPLKNAYIGGAGKWDSKKRCLYANFKFNDFHLISANGHENQSKGDKGPDGYIPPNKAYVCEYLHNFLFVKLIWNIALSPAEEEASAQVSSDNNCEADMSVTSSELQEQRNLINANADLCDHAVKQY